MAKQGKSHKAGKKADECKAYRNSQRREHNKAVKILKHLERYPDDVGAQKALDNLPATCVKKARKQVGANEQL